MQGLISAKTTAYYRDGSYAIYHDDRRNVLASLIPEALKPNSRLVAVAQDNLRDFGDGVLRITRSAWCHERGASPSESSVILEKAVNPGDKVRDFGDDLGIGHIVSISPSGPVAAFPTAQGGEITKTIGIAPALPKAIVIGYRSEATGSQETVDLTDDILSLGAAGIRRLSDGLAAKQFLAERGIAANHINLALPVSIYFGLMPSPATNQRAACEIHATDLSQIAVIDAVAPSAPGQWSSVMEGSEMGSPRMSIS